MPLRDPAAVSVKDLRVAAYTDNGFIEAAPALRRAVREAADALRARGVEVEEWSPPDTLPALRHGTSLYLSDTLSYAGIFNLLGMPAGVVAATRVRPGEESDREPGPDIVEATARKVEKGSAGLPVGVQVAAPHWREDVVLALMAALEEHFKSQPSYPSRPPL